MHGRAGADGLAADRDGRPQLDAAADHARHHPQRSRLQRRQLHFPAAHDEIRHHGLRHCLRRRHARPISRWRRPRPRPTRWSTSGWRRRSRRRQRLHLSMGRLARLRSVAGLEKITATVLAINSADDERNPPETGVTDAAIKRIKNGRLYLIPASPRRAGISPPATPNSTSSSCRNCCRPRRSTRCERRATAPGEARRSRCVGSPPPIRRGA